MRRSVLAATLALAFVQVSEPAVRSQTAAPAIELFFHATSLNDRVADAALAEIAQGWQDGYAAMFVDIIDLLHRGLPLSRTSTVRLQRLVRFLEDRTSQSFGANPARWREWVWKRPYNPHPEYGRFKGELYGQIDPRFRDFFQAPVRSSIRLDEVDWGGVAVNGIPPLEYPRHVSAVEARYLEDDNVVFGVYGDGVARAYPKRILAWHELARDRIGKLELTLVYCTLCGTVIPYDSHVGGKLRAFGTSGLLYQSNKLMFDAATRSLWSSLDGTPVVGPLVGSGLRLSMLPVVTTTWGEWKRTHPQTTALSLDTGFERDYSEGAAYRRYFATDRLMFGVSKTDSRLRNKAEVLVLRPPVSGNTQKPVAIAAAFLLANRVYHLDTADDQHLVVVTTAAGANRVYQAGPHRFSSAGTDDRVLDAKGRTWIAGEDELRAAFDPRVQLPRVPAHRAFWFGWYAQHPETRLIK